MVAVKSLNMDEFERVKNALIECGNMSGTTRWIHNWEECASELERRAHLAHGALHALLGDNRIVTYEIEKCPCCGSITKEKVIKVESAS